MAVDASTRRQIDDHLQRAEFSLRVASKFACLHDTAAEPMLREALARVGAARAWVKEKLAVEMPAVKPYLPPLGEGLPLTRKERLGYRWP